MLKPLSVLAVLVSLVVVAAADLARAESAKDSDGDGLPDAVEEALGTDKTLTEPLVTLGRFAPRSKWMCRSPTGQDKK